MNHTGGNVLVAMREIRSMARCLIGVMVLLLGASCTAPILVTTKRPNWPEGQVRRDSLVDLLTDLQTLQEELPDGDERVRQRYNFLVSRVVESVNAQKLEPWRSAVTLNGPRDSYRLTACSNVAAFHGKQQWFPVDTLKRKRELGKILATVDGVGAPLVAASPFDEIGNSSHRHEIPVVNLTAVIRFRGKEAQLSFYDPLQTETIELRGSRYRLAADYGAAMQLTLSKTRVDRLGFVRLLNPSRYDNTAHVKFTQAYDPQRIPVLMVHGLDSTPATFTAMYLRLMSDPEIRRRYQFWVFSYPSGYPYHYSAVLLRRELDSIRRAYPHQKPMVVMGHSMGGLITRLMLTDAGDQIWRKAFRRKPSETRVFGKSRKLLEATLVFNARPEISRAIFFSAPHRGSNLATSLLGRTMARLVKIPATIADASNLMYSIATVDEAGLMIQSAPNSIGTLAPGNPFVLAINEIPIHPRVRYHSVIGDRGKGDSPHSSDGVVSYWSSHLEGAASEKVIPSGHGSHVHPDGIAEARRILHSHEQTP
jgi:pimeloyl-ACP methyl ester carboxylesterase